MSDSETRCQMGPFLKSVALTLGFNATSIARKTGQSEATVRQWLSGRRTISLENTILISNAIGVNLSVIIEAYTIGYTGIDPQLFRSAFMTEWLNSMFVIHQELGPEIKELKPAHASAVCQKLITASKEMLDRKAMNELF
jgi:transcriptional regulator with XRE-family HTH domain